MDASAALDAQFREAVAAVDAGDTAGLERLLALHPHLAHSRLESPGNWLREKVGQALEGFFQRPYLLWFVAEDPVRNGTLPANIANIAGVIIRAAQREGAANLQEQLDYALSLVSWSWIARECGVQIALLDTLIDAGASIRGNANNALVNGNFAAAAHLVKQGDPLALATLLCMERWKEADRLATAADSREKQFSLTLAALHGKPEAVVRLLSYGADHQTPSEDLYSHATPLHHAVSSGSLETVRALAEAGADLFAKDTAFQGTPLGWAEHYLSQPERAADPKQYAEIADFLRKRVQKA